MTARIISGILILVACIFSVRHGWSAITMSPADANAAAVGLNLGRGTLVTLGVFSLVAGLLVLFPQTFLTSNVLSGCGIFYIAALQAHNRSLRGTLIEIPFLLLPLVMIYLGHPLRK